ncbi:Homocysteine-responsive endoplasmic reticulum-resident ubiquitin-like domain member 1 protein [Oryzias melastigma]|uniref:Homocysteine-inducible, endoplasmic reticulum stress-inducible, ubiquitin-like domain member 1 n=1 Tax=Oryzias melastigma TaxID=30732 RepID=A0A3B3C8W9_ORYME|nr:homocysteine-responsive endoplasmic reticulum-resident ubiquitin-like domain member 1 protein [Oryzias melastigma]KAF6737039.1 Homocysteine-responsive endoplasmic reticulum-resident ubiquitin-like domain member 1 protein [Oryzias melastigma]
MDVRGSPQKTTSLLIKTPSQAQEDRTVDGVSLSWTVRDLKTHLSTVYPTRPAVSEQRLIFAGKLLPDHLHLKDLFKQADIVPTLHLVCTVRSPPPPGAPPKTTDSHQPPAASPMPASASVQTSSAPELRQRRQTSPPTAAAPPPSSPGAAAWSEAPQVTPPTFPAFSLYSPQQLLWLQHVYARQYYMQYHAALAAAGSSSSLTAVSPYPPVPAHQVPVPPPLANQNPIDNLPANQNPVQDAGFINAGEANQNMRMNAQGGAVVEDEDGVERDWLDHLYSAARLGVLLVIVYFNSSLSRFLLVTSTLLLMYLHTAGWFPFRRRVQVQQNPDRNPPPDLAGEAAGGQGEEPAAEGPEGASSMTAVLVPPHRVSIMWTAWVFFKGFFSSLIPEVPQEMAH